MLHCLSQYKLVIRRALHGEDIIPHPSIWWYTESCPEASGFGHCERQTSEAESGSG